MVVVFHRKLDTAFLDLLVNEWEAYSSFQADKEVINIVFVLSMMVLKEG